MVKKASQLGPTQKSLQCLSDYSPRKELLKDKFIVITGATDGIGKEISLSCAARGARLLLLARNERNLDSLLRELPQHSCQTHQSYVMDFAIAGEPDYLAFTKFVSSQDTPVDSLVLNAGYIAALQGLRNYQLDTWLRTITINQHAPFMLLRSCIPSLEAANDPTIVFSTHDCTKAYWGAYGVAKSAQLGMLKILADELDGGKPIRVNGVDPAPVRTKLRSTNYPGIHPQSFPSPDTVVAPYLYFIGPDSKGVTGVNYKINADFIG